MPNYQYKPLPTPGVNEEDVSIRLVRLPKGEPTGHITCEMLTCPLSDSPEYEASTMSILV